MSQTDEIKALITKTNNSGLTFYDYLFDPIIKGKYTHDYASLLKSFIANLIQHHHEVIPSIAKTNVSYYLSIMCFFYDIKCFDSKTPLSRIKELLETDLMFVKKITYDRTIKYNYLNSILAKKNYNTLYKLLELLNTEQYMNKFIGLIHDHCYALSTINYNQQVDSEYINYFKKCISLIPQNQLKKVTIYKRNILHCVFMNKTLTHQIKYSSYELISKTINNNRIINELLSKKDRSGFFPAFYYLSNTIINEINIEFAKSLLVKTTIRQQKGLALILTYFIQKETQFIFDIYIS